MEDEYLHPYLHKLFIIGAKVFHKKRKQEMIIYTYIDGLGFEMCVYEVYIGKNGYDRDDIEHEVFFEEMTFILDDTTILHPEIATMKEKLIKEGYIIERKNLNL